MRFLPALLIATTLLFSAPVAAQQLQNPECLNKEHVVSMLQNEYREVPILRGVSNRGWTLELFVSDTYTWTVVLTNTNGCTKVGDAGVDLEVLSPPVIPPHVEERES